MEADENTQTRVTDDDLALAAAAVERVLPVYLRHDPLAADVCDDALRLVRYQAGGASVSKQEVARILNELLARIPSVEEEEARAAALAGRALVEALEMALRGSTSKTTLSTALKAVEAFVGEEGVAEERAWQDWAATQIRRTPGDVSAVRAGSGAPTCSWLAQLSREDLPLFGKER